MHWYVRGLSCKPNIYVSWSTSELRVRLAPWNRFKHFSKIILLTVPRRYFFCGSFMIFFLSCVCYAFVRICLFVPCGHLLGKGWHLGSRLWCPILSLSLSHWYPGSGVYLIVSIPDICTRTFSQLQTKRGAKVSKGTKIRNRYNQVPHLTQDTNGKVTNKQS